MSRHSGLTYPILLFAFSAIGLRPSFAAESRWIRLRSGDFELYTSAGPRNARDTIKQFEQVRGFFRQAFGGAEQAEPVRLVVFGSAREYEPYRLNEFATAYYHQTLERDCIVMSHGGADIFPTAVHEYVHLLVRRAGLKLPPWLNEGLAELYSTLRPVGGKILVGDLIPGRHRALLEDKWTPLEVILGADRASAYYNEKNKAGSLYNEGWALTHMLYFRPEYRPKVQELARSIEQGKASAQALQEVYGRTAAQLDKDLQAYLRGTSFQGVLFPATLGRGPEDISVEAVSDFDARLVLADLLSQQGKQTLQREAFARLKEDDPKRPEPYRGLGYLAWRSDQRDEALALFGKAFELGAGDHRFLWDYGRLLEGAHNEDAIPVLSQLLAQDAARLDVRLEVAESQLRVNRPADALKTLQAVRTVPQADSARFFRAAVYAHLAAGDRPNAEKAAQRFREIAKTDDDRAAADLLVAQTAANARAARAPVVVQDEGERPTLRRSQAPEQEKAPAAPPAPPRLSVSGRFVELRCEEKQASLVLDTQNGRRVFLIEDPAKVAVTSSQNGPVDLSCGAQKSPVGVTLEYDPPKTGQAGIAGIVRTLDFHSR